MCNLPIQILGNAPYPKYIKDYLDFGGAEVLIVDSNTKENILKFDPFPDDPNEAREYERKIRENLEKANKVIKDGVAKARTIWRPSDHPASEKKTEKTTS